MKSKVSFFSISPALVTENLRRFWAVSAVSFLIYFLSGPLPVLMSYAHINDMYDYLSSCFTNMQPIFLVGHLFMPIAAAVILFKYLQNSASVTTMHSMPFNRAQLFNSTLVSGMLLVLVPLLLNGVIFHIMAKPTYSQEMYVDYAAMTQLKETAVNIFTHSNINAWLLQSAILILSIYTVSVFAGILTGNVFMHIAAAFGLNFLIPALYGSFILYCGEFFFGFTTTGIHEELLLASSPFTELFICNGKYPMSHCIIYIASICLLIGISWYLYHKRALEKAGDSIVFKFVIPIICYLIAYFGMTLFGFYFKSYGFTASEEASSMLYFCIGAAAGSVLAFIIGRMIVLGTPRVFNKASFKSFGVYAVLAVLFLCSIIYDWTGFEVRVPADTDVERAAISAFEYFSEDGRYSGYYFSPLDKDEEAEKYFTSEFYFTDPENIKLITELHRELTGLENEITAENEQSVWGLSMRLDYDLNGNPFGLHRQYTLSYDRAVQSPYLKALYESKEFKDFYSLNRINQDEILSVNLSNSFYDSEGFDTSLTITSKEELKELFAVMEEDFRDRTFEEMTDLKRNYCNIGIYYQYYEEGAETPVKDSMYFGILQSDTATINWLKEKGYSHIFEVSADDVTQVVFYEYNADLEESEEYYVTDVDSDMLVEAKLGYTDTDEEDNRKKLVITDKAQISEILSSCDRTQIDYRHYYEGNIEFHITANDGSELAATALVYYQLDNAPSFISDYFK